MRIALPKASFLVRSSNRNSSWRLNKGNRKSKKKWIKRFREWCKVKRQYWSKIRSKRIQPKKVKIHFKLLNWTWIQHKLQMVLPSVRKILNPRYKRTCAPRTTKTRIKKLCLMHRPLSKNLKSLSIRRNRTKAAKSFKIKWMTSEMTDNPKYPIENCWIMDKDNELV